MNRRIQVLGTLCFSLIIAEVLLVIISWLLSATMMEGVRSLLSSEGIRWFFGSFTAIVASPLLVWLILVLSALGCLQKSGVATVFSSRREKTNPYNYRARLALGVAIVFLLIYMVIIALLTLSPHAILLSATGDLFPSAFSRSLIPIIAFGVVLFSIAFGMMSGRLKTYADILQALSFGIAKGAPLLVLLLLLLQFYASLRFVFT